MTAGEQTTGTKQAGTKTRPVTGGGCVETLRDGEVWLYGDRVNTRRSFGMGRMA